MTTTATPAAVATVVPDPPDVIEERRARFVTEFLIDLNATQAAIRSGYSKKSARAQASALLTDPAIAEGIRKALDARALRTGITQDRVLHELEQLAFSNIEDYVIEPVAGTVKLREGAPAHAMRAVSAIKHKVIPFGDGDTIHEVELKLWDKPGTLKLAGKHVGLFAERIEVTGKGGGPLKVQAVRAMSDEELHAALVEAAKDLAPKLALPKAGA